MSEWIMVAALGIVALVVLVRVDRCRDRLVSGPMTYVNN